MQDSIQHLEPYNAALLSKVIQTLYQSMPGLKNMDLPSRVLALSAAFLGRPYLEGSAGEGYEGSFDQSPLYRCDAFDCVTFLNTVLALALSNNVINFQKNILRVGYRDAQLGYQYRHHFMSADWNVCNIKNGLTEDITESIVNEDGKSIVDYAKVMIDRPNWFKHRTYEDIKLIEKVSPQKAKVLLQDLHALSEVLPCEKINMPYLPLAALFDKAGNAKQALFNQIPNASIVEIIRPNWNLREKIGTNLNVSHVGFAIRKDNQLLYRQASSIEKCVVDVPLVDYLRSRLESPSIKGIHVQRLRAAANPL